MTKDKKSMDDVLASIRRIIKTDPNAAPPDAASLPSGLGGSDETAKSVLEKLRGDDELLGKPLSTSDDPEETAQAVLAALRKQAEAEKARQQQEKPKEPEKPEKPKEPEKPEKPEKHKAAKPDPDEPLDDLPALDIDFDDVPVINESRMTKPVPAAAAPPARTETPKPAPARPPKEAPVMLDEAAMEAMVRRIVRDELMGEMGQRMTKNVQKMIRDEIARGRIEKK